MASYVVSGLGFLGGGVILREGLNVKGLNTAATIWCSGAVGSLCGSDLVGHAALGTFVILFAHLSLPGRPLDRQPPEEGGGRRYPVPDARCLHARGGAAGPHHPAAPRQRESHHDRPGLLDAGNRQGRPDRGGGDIYSMVRNECALEDLVNRINIEPGIIAVSWGQST